MPVCVRVHAVCVLVCDHFVYVLKIVSWLIIECSLSLDYAYAWRWSQIVFSWASSFLRKTAKCMCVCACMCLCVSACASAYLSNTSRSFASHATLFSFNSFLEISVGTVALCSCSFCFAPMLPNPNS